MKKLPFKIDLKGKTAVITGAGGVICGSFARALAACGASVALLDVNYDAAKAIADDIGDNAFAVKCNCLDKQSIIEAKKAVDERFGGGRIFLLTARAETIRKRPATTSI